jgi:hypothetical protein
MRRRVWMSVPLLLANAILAMAQSKMPAGPGSPPLILQRFREVVKIGRNDAHEALEHTWANAYAKSKLPVYSIAMTSMTGPNDAWWMSGYSSFKDFDEANASIAKNKELAATISQFSAKDVENISDGISTIWVLRQDLSYRDSVDWSHMHAYEVLTVRARPGHNDDVKKIAEKLAATHKAARTSAHWAMYQGLMGVPDGTYMVLIPHASIADLDVGMREDALFAKALGEVGGRELDKLSADGVISVETNLFAVSAKMSYVSDAWRAADADFWKGSAVLQAGAPMEKPAAKKP